MLNHIVIMGRLTKDPELRYTQSKIAVANFTVAVDRDYQQGGEKQVDFIECIAWRQGGEFISKYFHKGSMIVVTGSLQSRRWQDRDGNNRITWEIQTDHVYFGDTKREEKGSRKPAARNDYRVMEGPGDDNPFAGREGQQRQAQQYSGQQAGMWDSMNEEGDGELPF